MVFSAGAADATITAAGAAAGADVGIDLTAGALADTATVAGGAGLGGLASNGIGLGTAALGAAAINGAGQIVGANTAATAQTAAQQRALAAQQGYFNTTSSALYPFISTGQSAADKIGALEGLGNGTPGSGQGVQSTLESLPGYQFANTQGLKSVQNQATSRGLGLSGASLKGAANYSTGLANQYYNNLLTGLQNTENTGAGAAASLGSAATSLGQQAGTAYSNIGQAQGGAAIQSGNAIGGAANTIPNSLIASTFLQNQQNVNNNGSNGTGSGFLGTGVPQGINLQKPFAGLNPLNWFGG